MQTKASQFLQAEGLRYVIARSRDRAFNCSGSNVWQFNEPWPNVCCSSLVDYYGMPKMAYFALKRAYAPISATLKYDSIYLKEGVEHKLPVIVSNLGDCEKEISVTAQIIYNDTIIAQEIFTGVVAQDGAKQLGELRVNSDGKNLIFVRLICDGVADIYAFGNDESKVLNGLTKLAKTQIKTEVEGNKITLTNVGESGAYFIQIDFESESYTVSDNYVTLLPGESVEVYYYNADASTMSITQF